MRDRDRDRERDEINKITIKAQLPLTFFTVPIKINLNFLIAEFSIYILFVYRGLGVRADTTTTHIVRYLLFPSISFPLNIYFNENLGTYLFRLLSAWNTRIFNTKKNSKHRLVEESNEQVSPPSHT